MLDASYVFIIKHAVAIIQDLGKMWKLVEDVYTHHKYQTIYSTFTLFIVCISEWQTKGRARVTDQSPIEDSQGCRQVVWWRRCEEERWCDQYHA